MLIIRNAQMEALSQAMKESFESRAVAHLKRALPEETAELGESEVRQSVRLAVLKAGRHGLTDEYNILRFLNLMYVLGFHFDDDPGIPWARKILADTALQAGTRMDLLTERARQEDHQADGRQTG